MNTKQTHENQSDAITHSPTQRQGSLKLRLLVWFLLVALVPLTVVSAVSYYTAKESLRQAAFKAVGNDVEQRAAFFNNWFRYRLIDLKSQSSSVGNVRFLIALHEAFSSSGKDIGTFVKSYRWHTLVEERREDLDTFNKLYGYHDSFMIDAEGNVLFTVSGESDLGTNLFSGPYAETGFAAACRTALETGRPVFSDLEEHAPSNDKTAGFLVEVVLDEDGEKIGLFAIQISPDQIEYAARSMDVTRSHIESYVVGASKKASGPTLRSKSHAKKLAVLAVENRDSTMHGSSSYLELLVDSEQTQLWYSEHGPDGIEATDQIESIFIYDGPRGVPVLGVHKDFSMAGVHWGLIAEIPVSVAFAPAARLKNLMIVLVLITGVLVVIIATITTGRIVRPIVQLSNVAQLVADGDLTQRMHTSANDEIGALAYSFNAMVLSLSKSFADLSTLRFALDEHAIVSMTDIKGNITFANDKFCEISGYSLDELIGRNHRMIKSDAHSQEFYRELWKTIAGGDVWHGEIKNRAKDGSHYWVDATIVPFKDATGHIEQYVAIRTDITHVKEAEEKATHFSLQLESTYLELEGQKEETEAMNTELTALNYSLEAAQVEATEATRAKSAFLANMSHEIRTPMTAILGFSENLREGGLSDAEQHEAIKTIHKNGEYLLTIINDILDMSKIEAGKMEVEQIPCSPHTIVEDVATLMKVRSDAKKIAFNTEWIGSIPVTIQSDPTRLKQILINIIGNAIKFTDEGGVRLIARCVPGDVNGGNGSPKEPYLQFDIVDTGVGMTEEQAGHLFQAFAQADSTMTRKFGGTGLGLTISKKFAEMLGGDITIVDSQPGCGTRFRATVVTGSLEGVRMIEPHETAPSMEGARPSKTLKTDKPLDCRILLAEDGVDNQRLISFILKKAGADVTVAENGQIAVDEVMAAISQNRPFDVILMDMQMPVLDGYRATMALREKDYEGPIIALTAHAMASDREKCINAGCNDFASKPIDRAKLIDLIRTYVTKKEAVPSI